MDIDPTTPTNEDQVSSSTNIAPEDNKDSSAIQQVPGDLSTTGCASNSELPSEANVDQVLWTSFDDEEIDRELNSKETDIHQFMEDFRDFHALMIQLNETQYYGTRLDAIHAALESDLFDLMEELAYRRGEEAEELRQKAELEELLNMNHYTAHERSSNGDRKEDDFPLKIIMSDEAHLQLNK
ncbi:hypothetical protein CBL_14521 [Carabus blaptoides fortunei]